jgi:hypothetical protein
VTKNAAVFTKGRAWSPQKLVPNVKPSYTHDLAVFEKNSSQTGHMKYHMIKRKTAHKQGI